MTVRIWATVLAISLSSSFTAHAASCVAEYQQLIPAQLTVHETYAAGGGATAVGVVTGVGLIAVGSTGIGAVFLVVVGGGGLFVALHKKGEENEILQEITVYELYQESLAYQASPTGELPAKLAAFVETIKQGSKASSMDIPAIIVSGMEQGLFCARSQLIDSGHLLVELRQAELSRSPRAL